MAQFENVQTQAKERLAVIRLRTWTLTLAIIVTLVLYFLVQLGTKQAINPIDFAFLTVVQLLTYVLYFPDGEQYGTKSTIFKNNKLAYNKLASKINKEHLIGKLREFCKYDFERRKKEYIDIECGALGITLEELELLKQKTPNEIKDLAKFEVNVNNTNETKKPNETKFILFSKNKRKRLSNLLFKDIPIEMNHPETIMSALENNGNRAIKDDSSTYKTKEYIKKFILAVIIGGTFAYIGYTLRDGIGLTEIVSISMYLTALFSNAVTAFSSGEKCTKIYKNNFYMNLSNFINGFFEWANVDYEDKQLEE